MLNNNKEKKTTFKSLIYAFSKKKYFLNFPHNYQELQDEKTNLQKKNPS
jgi:hypothetical protein